MSSGVLFGSISAWTVRYRSYAEIPVETPRRASTDTVKAVDWVGPFRATINGIWSSSSRSPSIGMQIRPRPCCAMKLMTSGVANCAATARSPSFSRSSSSTIRTIRPIRKSSIASTIVQKDASCSDPFWSGPGSVAVNSSLQEALDVFGEDVDFNVYRGTDRLGRHGDHLLCIGDQRHPEAVTLLLGHRQADTVKT